MEKSEAAGGANPMILVAVSLTGPRQSSSGHNTKVSIALGPYGFMVCDQLVSKGSKGSSSISSNFATTISHMCGLFLPVGRLTFLDPPMERLIAVTGDERRVESEHLALISPMASNNKSLRGF